MEIRISWAQIAFGIGILFLASKGKVKVTHGKI